MREGGRLDGSASFSLDVQFLFACPAPAPSLPLHRQTDRQTGDRETHELKQTEADKQRNGDGQTYGMGVQFSRTGRVTVARYSPAKDWVAGRLNLRGLFRHRARQIPRRLLLAGAISGGGLLGAELYFGRLGRGDTEFRKWEKKFEIYREVVQELRRAARQQAEGQETPTQTDDYLTHFLDEARLAEIQELLLHQDLLEMLGNRLNLLAILGQQQWKDRFLRLALDMYEFMVERHRNGNPFIDIQKQLDNVAAIHVSLLTWETDPKVLDWYWETHFRQLLRMYTSTGFSRASDSVWMTLGRYIVDKSIQMQTLLDAEEEELREKARQEQESSGSVSSFLPEMDPDGLFLSSPDIAALPLSASFLLLPPEHTSHRPHPSQANNPAKLTLSQVLRALEIAMQDLTQGSSGGPCLQALHTLVGKEAARGEWRELGRRALLGDEHADAMCRQLVSVSGALGRKIERYRRELAAGIVREEREAPWTDLQLQASCFLYQECERTVRDMLRSVGHLPQPSAAPIQSSDQSNSSSNNNNGSKNASDGAATAAVEYDDWVTLAQPFLLEGLPEQARELLEKHAVNHFEDRPAQARNWATRTGEIMGVGFFVALLSNLRYLRRVFKDDSEIFQKWREARDATLRKYYGLREEEEITEFVFADDDPLLHQRKADPDQEQLYREDPELAAAIRKATGEEERTELPPRQEVNFGVGQRGSGEGHRRLRRRPATSYELGDLPAPPPPRPRRPQSAVTDAPPPPPPPPPPVGKDPQQQGRNFSTAAIATAGLGLGSGAEAKKTTSSSSSSSSSTSPASVSSQQDNPFQRRNFYTQARMRWEQQRPRNLGVVRTTQYMGPDGRWCWVTTYTPVRDAFPSLDPKYYSTRRPSSPPPPSSGNDDSGNGKKDKTDRQKGLRTTARQEKNLPPELRRMGERMAAKLRSSRAAPPKLTVHEKAWLQVHQPPRMVMLGTPTHVMRFGSRFLGLLALASVGTYLTVLGPAASPSLLMKGHNSEELAKYFRRSPDSRLTHALDAEDLFAGMFSPSAISRFRDFMDFVGDSSASTSSSSVEAAEDRFRDFRAPATHELYDREAFRRLLVPTTAALGVAIPLWIVTIASLFPYALPGSAVYLLASSLRRR